ncbi:MAG TPA: hypothetical protein VEI96_04125 [Thermodesulfovibrionales bacterium]|nr:hypothetical protein [Thermodesulfovibrionales bacterium]
MSEEPLRIKSSRGGEFNSEIEIGGEKYFIQTEDGGVKNPLLMTRVYLKGRIIYSKETDCGDVAVFPDRDERIRQLMEKQHQMAFRSLMAEKAAKERTAVEYLEEVRGLIGKKKEGNALLVLDDGLRYHPDDPFLLSYYGYLDVMVNKHYKEGIQTCKRAIESLKGQVPFGEEFFYPFLYLNLGRAYIAAGNKKEAIRVFNRGLHTDGDNGELRGILKSLGTRRRPVVPFLGRSNFLNRYLGLFFSRLGR